MYKKIILTVVVIGLFIIAACGSETTYVPDAYSGDGYYDEIEGLDYEGAGEQETEHPETEQPVAQRPSTPVRGVWEDGVFTSEYLGLRFVLPDGWDVADDNELAELMGMGMDFMTAAGAEISQDVWQLAEIVIIYDFLAASAFGGANVQIMYERLTFPHTRISTERYIELTLSALAASGITAFNDIEGTTMIGGYEWHSIRTVMNMFGMDIHGRQFINVKDGFARIILFTHHANSETVDELLAMFIGLDDPIPGPVEIIMEHEPALVGTWVWDWSPSYVYVFYADGRGTRGFEWMDTEVFEWHTQGNNHLFITLGFTGERWEFEITNDMLTLNSRQVPGMTYSYFRHNPNTQIEFEHEPELLGEWIWDGDDTYVYTFNADGTGTRGFSAWGVDDFVWHTVGENRLVISMEFLMDFSVELWYFEIEGDMFTIVNSEAPEVTFSYIRRNAE